MFNCLWLWITAVICGQVAYFWPTELPSLWGRVVRKEPGLGRSNAWANSWDSGIEALGARESHHAGGGWIVPVVTILPLACRDKKLRFMVLSHKPFFISQVYSRQRASNSLFGFCTCSCSPKGIMWLFKRNLPKRLLIFLPFFSRDS